jgi:putative aldouronate transport system permease protein
MRIEVIMGKIKRSLGENLFDSANILFMILLCVVMLYPFWHIILYSINSASDSDRGGLYLWPRIFTLANYKFMFDRGGIFQAYFVSAMRILISVPIHLFVTSMTAFALSRPKILFRNFIITFFFITMIFSGGMIPSFLVLNYLKLINTFWIYLLPGMFGVWSFIVFKTMLRESVPEELIESALMDGSGFFTVFLKFVIPLSLPSYAALGLFNAIGQWNDWFTGIYYIRNSALVPIQSYLRMFLNSTSIANDVAKATDGKFDIEPSLISPTSVKMAAVAITTIPILIVYPFVQRYFVKGVLIGAIKA